MNLIFKFPHPPNKYTLKSFISLPHANKHIIITCLQKTPIQSRVSTVGHIFSTYPKCDIRERHNDDYLYNTSRDTHKVEEPILVRVIIWTVEILLYLIFQSPKPIN
jgi:hypothetical protein